MPSCIEMPPPAPPAPAPSPAPVPAPGPYAPAPGPAAPPGFPPAPPPPPPAPAPYSSIVLDLANSTFTDNRADPALRLVDVLAQGGKIINGYSGTLVLVFQNTGTGTGSINARVSSTNGNLGVTPGGVTNVAVGAAGYTTVVYVLSDQSGVGGTYPLSIDTGTGSPLNFNLGFLPPEVGGGA